MGFFDFLNNGASESTSSPNAQSQAKSLTFSFDKLPSDLEEMKQLPEISLDSPFKAAALCICALCAYGESKEAGIEMLNFLKGPVDLSEYEKQFLRDRFSDGKKYISYSFFAGSSPDNNYTPTQPYTLTVFDNPYSYQEENYAVLHVRSTGADSPRQIKLRRKGEQWFLWEQFLLSDIRIPKAADPWA